MGNKVCCGKAKDEFDLSPRIETNKPEPRGKLPLSSYASKQRDEVGDSIQTSNKTSPRSDFITDT